MNNHSIFSLALFVAILLIGSTNEVRGDTVVCNAGADEGCCRTSAAANTVIPLATQGCCSTIDAGGGVFFQKVITIATTGCCGQGLQQTVDYTDNQICCNDVVLRNVGSGCSGAMPLDLPSAAPSNVPSSVPSSAPSSRPSSGKGSKRGRDIRRRW